MPRQNRQAVWLPLGGQYPYRDAAVLTVYRGLLQPGSAVKSQIPELCYCYYIQFKVMLGGFIVISFS